MTDRETVVYRSVRELPIRADIYRPSGEGIRPAILWIHGGALIAGSREDIRAVHLDAYRNAGHVVVSMDYRLAPETKLPEIIDDLRAALRWTRGEGSERFGIDPQRLAVVGHSAGGYLTLMSGVCGEPPPQALIAFYGYGDILGDWYAKPDDFCRRQPLVSEEEARRAVGQTPLSDARGKSDRFRFYLYCRQQGRWLHEVGGRDPVSDRKAFEPYCPALCADANFPPTLLLHGDADTDVPHEQSVQMTAALERAGVPREFVSIPGGAHGFDRDHDSESVRAAFDRALQFLETHLLKPTGDRP